MTTDKNHRLMRLPTTRYNLKLFIYIDMINYLSFLERFRWFLKLKIDFKVKNDESIEGMW